MIPNIVLRDLLKRLKDAYIALLRMQQLLRRVEIAQGGVQIKLHHAHAQFMVQVDEDHAEDAKNGKQADHNGYADHVKHTNHGEGADQDA